MKLIHKRDIIRGVADRWWQQYKGYGRDYRLAGGEKVGDLHDALCALDLETCSSADVDSALGVKGWADNECMECRTDHEILVHIGQEPDYEALYLYLCESCLKRALKLLKGATK